MDTNTFDCKVFYTNHITVDKLYLQRFDYPSGIQAALLFLVGHSQGIGYPSPPFFCADETQLVLFSVFILCVICSGITKV